MRFDKQQFTNGEPVVAARLIRNISDKRLLHQSFPYRAAFTHKCAGLEGPAQAKPEEER
jgi:hypothetical protein